MNEDMKKLIEFHLNREGMEVGVSKEEATHNLHNVFMPTVLEMESSGNYQAVNIPQEGKEATSAKGGFQFVAGSVQPAINRLSRRIGMKPWMKEAIQHKDASKLTEEQQQLMFMADVLEKDGSDSFMKKVMEGDKQGSMDAYYKLHHTAPDDATKKRAKKVFGEVYGERLTGDKEGDNMLTNDGKGIVKEGSKEHLELMQKQTNQVLSDEVAKGLTLKETMRIGLGFEQQLNSDRNKE